MKLKICLVLLIAFSHFSFGQKANPYRSVYPNGTVFHENIAYNADTLKKHLLDIYLPPNAKDKTPLVILIHGGGWLVNDKYADLGYMKKTMVDLLNQGYALASIDYRWASQAVFPALIQDCNRAASFLLDNAKKYNFDTNNFALMGWSAGGHLASLMGLSKNNNVPTFFMPNSSKSFKIKAVVDFYGPSDLVAIKKDEDPNSPECILLGDSPINRPDLAKIASPVTYVDKNDPPFLIIHGEKDDMVSPLQSKLLHSWLKTTGAKSELIIVKDAPHYGTMFDVDEIREKVVGFLKSNFN
jgi:acetyl esterase/lipase